MDALTPPTSNTAASQPIGMRLLNRLVLIKPGEGRALFWSAAYFFCLLMSYYMLRPIREAMGIEGGYDKLPWLMSGTMLVMLAANPLFAALVSRVPRRRFIPMTYRFFAINILIFCSLFLTLPANARIGLGYAFYIWLSVFNLFVISIFWAFMADVFTTEQARRLFGFIGIGGTLGAIAGPAVTGWLVGGISIGDESVIQLEPPLLLPVSVVLLELALQCMLVLMRSSQTVQEHSHANSASLREPGPGPLEGLRLLVRSPYLLTICLYMLPFAITSTFLYLEQGRIIEQEFTSRDDRLIAFARIDQWANVLTLCTQLFLTGRLIRWIGVGGALAIVPMITLAGFGSLMLWPAFTTLLVVMVLRRGLHYAVDRPARESLFTIVGPDEKYKTKSFIDTFVYRGGDFFGGWTPLVLKQFSIAIGWIGIPLALVGAALGLMLGVMNGSLLRERQGDGGAVQTNRGFPRNGPVV
jgi:ATP:ADP antiporter, AAA family